MLPIIRSRRVTWNPLESRPIPLSRAVWLRIGDAAARTPRTPRIATLASLVGPLAGLAPVRGRVSGVAPAQPERAARHRG